MEATVQVQFFCVATPCFAVVGYQHSRGLCCLHLQGEVKLEVAQTPEMLVPYHNTTRRRNAEGPDMYFVCLFCLCVYF
jgi:hypothetical protein